MPKISVIIPCYNVAPYIDRCLASVLAQTIGMDNLEVICVDDASEDNTWERLRMWERLYPNNILLIRQETNRRQGTARNIGVAYASADWIAFIDADDWVEPDYFELLYHYAMECHCDMVCCGFERDYSSTLVYLDEKSRDNGEDLYIFPYEKIIRKELIISDVIAGVWGILLRKSLILDQDIFFPEDVAYEDMYFQALVCVYTGGVYVVGKKLYHYFVNTASTVLRRNSDHHMDWLTVWMRLWEECGKRGLLDLYREELEYCCMKNAVGFVQLLILRYSVPSFSLFRLTSQILRERVPEYRENPYIERFTDIYPMVLEKLYEEPFNRSDFELLVGYVKTQWEIE
ncbi:MAG: glycosyltransferase family 2 protein [Hungatella sp.]|nr:glycosyltransferase family 2 protein [Hungatella sp.]